MRPIFWNSLGLGLAILAIVAVGVWLYRRPLPTPEIQEQ